MATGTPSRKYLIRTALGSYRKELRFLLYFIAILAGLNFVYFLVAGSAVEEFVLSVLTAKPAYAIIRFLAPHDAVVLQGNHLTSPHVNFAVIRGCEGMEGILLMISAICAFQIPWRDRLLGLLAGLLFIYSFNILRIVALYFVMTHFQSAFAFAHLFVGQSITIVIVAVFFVLWVSRSQRKHETESPG